MVLWLCDVVSPLCDMVLSLCDVVSPSGRGGYSHVKRTGVLVVPFRG